MSPVVGLIVGEVLGVDVVLSARGGSAWSEAEGPLAPADRGAPTVGSRLGARRLGHGSRSHRSEAGGPTVASPGRREARQEFATYEVRLQDATALPRQRHGDAGAVR